MPSLSEIESATKSYADARGNLKDLVSTLNADLEIIKRRRLPGIKKAVALAAERHTELNTLVKASPELFVRPRTVVFHGIKVGWGKCGGGVIINDVLQVIKLIKKYFAEKEELLIKTKESLVKKALAQLPASDLRKIGCSIETSKDGVIIQPADGDVEKIVDALMKEAVEVESETDTEEAA